MTVIHHNFGGGSPLPESLGGGALDEPTSPPQPHTSGRANCAREIADRAHRWIEDAIAAREGLTPQQRREIAFQHMDQAQDARCDPKAPIYMTVIGRHAWTARIMMAED